jgi:hypothetical protein
MLFAFNSGRLHLQNSLELLNHGIGCFRGADLAKRSQPAFAAAPATRVLSTRSLRLIRCGSAEMGATIS